MLHVILFPFTSCLDSLWLSSVFFDVMLSGYVFILGNLNDLEIVSFAPIFTGIIFVIVCQVCCISIVRSVYFKLLLVYVFVGLNKPVKAFSWLVEMWLMTATP